METLQRLLDQVEGISALSDDELAQLLDEIVVEALALAEGDDSDEALALVQKAVEARAAITTEQEARQADADGRATRAADLIAMLQGGGDEGDPETEDEPESSDDDPDEEPEEEAKAADPEPAEVVAEEVAEPIAASAPKAPVVSRVAARRAPSKAVSRAQARPAAPVNSVADWGLVASANSDLPMGHVIQNEAELADVFLNAWAASEGMTMPKATYLKLARAGSQANPRTFGVDRFLDRDEVANGRKISAVTSHQAITASGGICAPLEVRYDIPFVGSTERPVRDALVRFGADRGGVRTIPPAVMSEVTGGVGLWTEANDQNPSSPTVKPCLVMTCPDEDETVVDAVTKCLEIGNFRARYFPEQVAEWTQLLSVWQARFAEQTLIDTIANGSTDISVGQVFGTTRTILAALAREVAIVRYNYRMPRSFPLRLLFPEWVYENMKADLIRQMPVGSLAETLAVADSDLDSFFAALNIRVTLMKDAESGQRFSPQGDGTLNPWPSTVVGYVFPEGAWLFLDGGTLDLGIFRDSGLVETNDYRMFSETFEAAHFHGQFSHRFIFDICPDGTAAALATDDPCGLGS